MRARTSARGLALLTLLLGCHHRETLRFEASPPRAWDLAWLVALDEEGAALSPAVLFEQGAAGLELDERAEGHVIVGLVLSEIPRAFRQRLDPTSMELATLEAPSSERGASAPEIRVVGSGTRIELDVDAALPYFDVLGPTAFDPGQGAVPGGRIEMVAQLPASAHFCRPVTVRPRVPALATEGTPLWSRSVHELHALGEDLVLASLRPLFTREPARRAALLRVREGVASSDDDVVELPGSDRSGVEDEMLRNVSLGTTSSSSAARSALALRLEFWTDAVVEARVESGLLHHLALPSEGSWASLEATEIRADGPLVGRHPAAARAVAQHPDGFLIVVGGAMSGNFPRGYLAIGLTSSVTPSFELHDVLIEGATNGDVLDRVAALPDDPSSPGLSMFAVAGQRGQILVLGYDPSERRVVERDRYVPPLDVAVRDGAGYERLYAVDRKRGPELWAHGHYGSIIRRTVGGEWQSVSDLLRDGVVVDESAIACRPFGYPDGRLVNDVAHSLDSVLVTFARCSGALLLRFDEDDQLACATGVLRPGESALRIDDKNDFGAVVSSGGRFLLANIGRLNLLEVDPD